MPNGSTAAAPPVRTLASIQVLRALAALSVVVHHAAHDGRGLEGASAFGLGSLFPWMAGVDIFFVISGFIMVHASRRLFGAPGGWRVFARHRLARIVPLYWLATTAFLAVALMRPSAINSEAGGAAAILASYLFIPFPRPDGLVQPLFSLGWTLNFEMFFYLVFAAVLILPRGLAVAAAAMGLGALVFAGQLIDLPLPLAFWARPIVLEFVGGMALALLHARGLRLSAVAAGCAALAGFTLLAAEPVLNGVPELLGHGLPALLIVGAAACGPAPGDGPAVRLWSRLGDASYALYLTHPFAIRALSMAFASVGLGGEGGAWLLVASSLVLSTGIALAVHRAIERPLTRLLRGPSGAEIRLRPSA